MKNSDPQHSFKTHVRFFLSFTMFFLTCLMATNCFSVKRQVVKDVGVVGTFYYSEDSTQQPPIIIFGGSSGGNFYESYRNYLEDLVNNGYSVLSLAYFDYGSTTQLPNKLHHIPLEYFKKAMNWMTAQPQTSKEQFAVIGYSRGSEAALLLGIEYPEITTVVAISPSAYVGGAYDNERKVTGSAWTFENREIPYVDYHKAVAHYRPWWRIIDDKEEVEPFAIPVEKLSAAILLLSGEKDRIWPSTEMSKRMIQRLDKHQYTFPYRHISYDAGHNIRVVSWPDLLDFIMQNYPR